MTEAQSMIRSESGTIPEGSTEASHQSQVRAVRTETAAVTKRRTQRKKKRIEMRPADIEWLESHYEYSSDESISRQDAYHHYEAHCMAIGWQPAPATHFGKLVRYVFPAVETRRFGTRGASRYHYGKIRRKASPLSTSSLSERPSTSQSPVPADNVTADSRMSLNSITSSPIPAELLCRQPSDPTTLQPISITPEVQFGLPHAPAPSEERQMPVYNYSPAPLPKFIPPVENDMTDITDKYEKHCHDLLECIVSCQFSQIKTVFFTFYETFRTNDRRLLQNRALVNAIWRWDSILYDAVISTFLPHLGVKLPVDVARDLQKMTQDLEYFIDKAVQPLSKVLYERKSDVARVFSAKFQRCLSINRTAQAAGDILCHPGYVEDMHRDWMTLDLRRIVDDALWIDEIKKPDIMTLLQEDIVRLFESKATLSEWTTWIECHVQKGLIHHSSPSVQVQRWALYSSSLMNGIDMQLPSYR
ncbi:Transcription factor rfx3 [Apophysomyces sp. BC1034]|nr:Transcription factor rfx3 [Apophysomyces sp. BC1034]